MASRLSEKVRWYVNRLRLMQPAELAHRVLGTAKALVERAGLWRLVQVPEPSLINLGSPWVEEYPDDSLDPSPSLVAADSLLQGRWRIFSIDAAPLGFPPEWNRDPLSGTLAPLTFGKLLDYRDEKRVGNIKYLWEPSRHLELVTLAQAWRASGDQRYLDACATLLNSWFEQCPFPLGVHWSSALESAVRLLNWSVGWHLLGGVDAPLFGGDEGLALRRRWLDQVYLHQRFICGHLSRNSSANNHLLGELMGLFVASLTWPCWRESPGWLSMSQQAFEAEALRQNWEDGVNKEQGIYYHHEVADMMLLCGLYGRANGRDFSPALWRRLQAMLVFIDAIMDVSHNVPMFGDADDALMVRFDPRPEFNPFLSLLCTGAELFGQPQWRRGPNADMKTRWLLGSGGMRIATPPLDRQPRAFPQGGYWILGSSLGNVCEVKLVADAGPLGYLSIAAHGHADALAFTMSLGGQEILVDPGTYAYHTQPQWRDYFRGTSAHNTLRVDGLDQSVIGGNFMWLDKASARCTYFSQSAEADEWVGEHDGYLRLADPVLHRRRIAYRPEENLVRVTDDVVCLSGHQLEWHWHFAPACTIELSAQGAIVHAPGWRLELFAEAGDIRFSVHRGQEAPPLGWISRRFDHKEPSPTLRGACSVLGSRSLVSQLRFSRTDIRETQTK